MSGVEGRGRWDTAASTPKATGRTAERRYKLRRSGLWAAQLQTADSDPIPCLLLDLSPGGARLVAQRRPFSQGSIVTLVAPVVGTRRARIAWLTSTYVGLQFLGHTADNKFRPF